MSVLTFQVVAGVPDPYAASPTLLFRLRIAESSGQPVESVALRCQIRIEPQRRRYAPSESERLLELFGETPRWGDTMKPFLWTHVSHMVPPFVETIDVDLPVPCTYDLEIAAAKYFHALAGGEIPLIFLFSGSVFARGESGLQVTQVPWDREATYRLPVAAWRALMDLYFPNGGWLRLRRETIDALTVFKGRRALPGWDDVVETLLREADEADRPRALALPRPHEES